jgi:hypothetical protein
VERLHELAPPTTRDHRSPRLVRRQPVIAGRSQRIAGRALRCPRDLRVP